MKKLNKNQRRNKEVDLDYEKFGLTWEGVERVESSEDDWVSSILGNESDAINSTLNR